MREELQTIVDTYINAFDSFPCDDAKVQADIAAFKKSVIELGEKSDITNFMTRFSDEGYMKTYMDLFGRITLINAAKTQQGPAEKKPQITPKAFVEQYREGYNAIRSCKYLPKTEAVYQRLFELGDTCADMPDLNIIAEKEDLYFKLSSVNAVERFEIYLEASDPLNKILYQPQHNMAEAWETAHSDAEVQHNVRVAETTNIQNSQRESQAQYLVIEIAATALFYVKAKLQTRHFTKDENAKNGIAAMISLRKKMKRLMNVLPKFNLSWEKIRNDKFYRHWLLEPENIDETARFTACDNPKNIEIIGEIIDELLSEKTASELLFASEKNFFNVKKTDASREHKQYEQIADAADSQMTYYKYKVACTNI